VGSLTWSISQLRGRSVKFPPGRPPAGKQREYVLYGEPKNGGQTRLQFEGGEHAWPKWCGLQVICSTKGKVSVGVRRRAPSANCRQHQPAGDHKTRFRAIHGNKAKAETPSCFNPTAAGFYETCDCGLGSRFKRGLNFAQQSGRRHKQKMVDQLLWSFTQPQVTGGYGRVAVRGTVGTQ